MTPSKQSVESAAIWRHTLGDLLRRTAARFPTKVAIVCGEVQWTYAEFDAVCNRLAHGLLGVGASAGDRVAVLGECAWKSKRTGQVAESPFAQFFTFRDGRIAAIVEMFDTATAVAVHGRPPA